MSVARIVATASPRSRVAAPFLQRKCACGAARSSDQAECDACQSKRAGLQAKTIGNAGDDPFEIEADRAAEEALRVHVRDEHFFVPIAVRGRVADSVGQADTAAPEVGAVLANPGQPLGAETRRFFETRFGHDFGRVRVHSGPLASASARAVGARAFASGRHVVLGEGASPESTDRRLLAHELAHVVQQQNMSGAVAPLQRAPAATSTLEIQLPYDGRILSVDELRKSAERAAAFKFTGQTEATLLDAPDPAKGRKVAVLAADTHVSVRRVAVAPTIYKASGRWVEGGAGWYEVESVDEPKSKGYLLGVFVAPKVEPKKEPVATKKDDKNSQLDLTLKLIRAPEDALTPYDMKAMVKQALEQRWGNGLSRADETLLKNYSDDKRVAEMLHGREPPIIMVIQLPGGLDSAPQKFAELRKDFPLFITPYSDVQFGPDPTWFPGLDEKSIAWVDPNPQYSLTYGAVKSAPTAEQTLLPYIDVSETEAPKVHDDASAVQVNRIVKKLFSLSESDRKRFLHKMHSWDEFEQQVDAFIRRQQQIEGLKKATPDAMTGGAIEKILKENLGVKPETDEIAGKLGAVRGEYERRYQRVEQARKEIEPLLEVMRKNLGIALDPNQQLNFASAVFARGFLAGAEYEIAPSDWKKLNESVAQDQGGFNAGILTGLIPGAIEGIWKAFEGLVELAVLLAKLGYHATARQVKDVYEPLTNPGAFKQRKQEEQAVIESFIDGAKELAQKFKADPAFLSAAAFDIGLAAGKGSGDWFSDDFMQLSVFGKGELVGEVIGRIIIEVVMLIVAPEEIVARGAAQTGARVGSKVIEAVEKLAESIPALKRLLDARRLAKVAKIAEEADEASKLLRGGTKVVQDARAAEASAAKATRATEELGDAARQGNKATKAVDEAAAEAADAGAGAEKVLVKKPVGDGHDIAVTEDGIRLCSPPPCSLIRKRFARELEDNPRLAEQLAHAERNANANPDMAESEAEEVYRELKRIREEAGATKRAKVDPYFRDLDRLRAEAKGGEEARKELAEAVTSRMPEGTRVKVVKTERTEAGMAQGRAAARDAKLPNPDVEYEIDLPDKVRGKAELPARDPRKPATGTFKPDDIRFYGEKGDKFLFLDHKEVDAAWDQSYYNSEQGRQRLVDMLKRHLRIVEAMGDNCKGFAYTTNNDELAKVLAEEIQRLGAAAKGRLFPPGKLP